MAWKDLSIREKQEVIRTYVKNGISNLKEIRQDYDNNVNRFANSGAAFSQRLRNNDTRYIQNEDGSRSTHRLGYATDGYGAVIFPEVQEGLRGLEYGDLNSAIEKQDTVRTSVPFAEYYTENYKNDYPEFFNRFDVGGDTDGEENNKITLDDIVEWAKRDKDVAFWLNRQIDKAKSKYPSLSHIMDSDRKFVEERRKINESGRIPFIKDKKITLTNAGKSTGATFSTNLLDTLAKYGAISNTNPYDVIGLASRETEFGAYPLTYLNAGEDGTENQYRGQNYFVNNGSILPASLINNSRYYSNPYNDALSTAGKIVGAKLDRGDSRVKYLSSKSTNKRMDNELKGGVKYADKMAKKIKMNEHPLIHGFNLFKSKKFNAGDKGYNDKVRSNGESVFNSPEIIDWWNNGGRDWYIGTQYEKFNP